MGASASIPAEGELEVFAKLKEEYGEKESFARARAQKAIRVCFDL